jgi:hypothetical protein
MHSFASSLSSISCQSQELVNSFAHSIPMVDLNADDVIFNPITTKNQLPQFGDGKPWRGSKEKSEQVMQLFITSLNPKDDIVDD